MKLVTKNKALIYIVEKEYECLKEYESIFNIYYPNFDVKYFTHLSDLENETSKVKPDIAIIDCDNGFGMLTCKRLKEDSSIKIIVSSSNDKNAMFALENGCSGYLIKPPTKEKMKELFE